MKQDFKITLTAELKEKQMLEAHGTVEIYGEFSLTEINAIKKTIIRHVVDAVDEAIIKGKPININ